MEKLFKDPVIKRGQAPANIPKGSSKLKELAKNMWYVEYFFLNPKTGKFKQFRIKDGINRIKDAEAKEEDAKELRRSIQLDLDAGYNPFDKHSDFNIIKEKLSLKLSEAIDLFIDYHKRTNSRKKTIGSYSSKLKILLERYPDKKVDQISKKDLEDLVLFRINNETRWSQVTVKAAKGVYTAFFNYMARENYIENNPVNGFDRNIKSIKETPERHVPFSPEDLKNIMKWLRDNDPYSEFFCKMIYYTCIRPGEIIGLKLSNINIGNKSIVIPASVKKTTTNSKADTIYIDDDFIAELEKLNLNNYSGDKFLTGDAINIIGDKSIGTNIPYKRFRKCLTALNLLGKGYDLYSFKHTSNVKKWESGDWKMTEIMKANRHSSLAMTEKYLRGLTKRTDISGKKVPTI